MVPFHIIAGALDRRGTNILFNWVVPILLVVWAAKQSTGAGRHARRRLTAVSPSPAAVYA